MVPAVLGNPDEPPQVPEEPLTIRQRLGKDGMCYRAIFITYILINALINFLFAFYVN
jgi:hypothetical protein